MANSDRPAHVGEVLQRMRLVDNPALRDFIDEQERANDDARDELRRRASERDGEVRGARL